MCTKLSDCLRASLIEFINMHDKDIWNAPGLSIKWKTYKVEIQGKLLMTRELGQKEEGNDFVGFSAVLKI